jgi:FkbM family methyltransferase
VSLGEQPSLSIVQVGAFIGDTPNDPLVSFLRHQLDPATKRAETNVKVVLVEPVREYFNTLRRNYEGLSNIQFENVAIAESEGVRQLYRLKLDPAEYGYPEWLKGLSSLKAERMERLWDKYDKNPALKRFYLEHRVAEGVRCITLSQLLDQHDIDQLDLLQIDAEGYDFEILKSIDFSKIKPRFINYERVLLQENNAPCRQLLSDQGYILMDWGQDTLCILPASAARSRT